MFFIGLNSGTSVDAIDAAVVEIQNNTLSLFNFIEFPIPDHLRHALLTVDQDTNLHDSGILNVQLGELFAEAVNELLVKSQLKANEINAIGLHGQTIFHSPKSSPAFTLQIGDANTVVAKTGISVVNDFRGMDMANGGEGAPLAPAFHEFQFNVDNKTKVILNIGGISNISFLNKEQNTIGFDTGPGNGLMNAWIKKHHDKEFDENGNWASKGKVNDDLLKLFLADDYFKLSPPKSTGREYFNLDWLEKKLKLFKQDISTTDIQTSLLAFTTKSILNDIQTHCTNAQEIIVCGGGAYNLALMQQLKAQTKIPISTTEKYSIPPNSVEACLFAWLAYCRVENIAIDLTHITGTIKPCILGAVYSC